MRRTLHVVVLLAAVTLGFRSGLPAVGAEAPKPRGRAEGEAVLAKAPKPSASQELRHLNVLLLADVKDHGPGEHDYPHWQKRWQQLLEAGATNVQVTTAMRWPSPEQLKTADLLVMFCYHGTPRGRALAAEQIDQLEAFLARGGGFVPVHSATYTTLDLTQADGKRFLALTGVAFAKSIRYRHGPVELKIADAEHPICLGLPRTLQFVDEPYWPPTGDLRAVHVLATSEESVVEGAKPSPQPMFWTHSCGKGRVFGCVMGHYNWTFDAPYFRLLLLRGMAWAAGESPYRFDSLTLCEAMVTDVAPAGK